MINEKKWIGSLSGINKNYNREINQIDNNIWINTIPKKNTYNSFKKYSLTGILFVCGLLFVSALKNETRNLQKEVNNLEASIHVIKFNLDQARLDYEVITSPENISQLATEHLNNEFTFYKKSQIRVLNDKEKVFTKVNKFKKEKNKKKTNKDFVNLKIQVSKRIEQKKAEIKKLQELYSNPKSIPGEVAKKIKKKKDELKKIYTTPEDKALVTRAQRWAALQVVKAFLGMPVIPGK